MDHDATFQLTPIATYILRERLIKRIEEVRRDEFEEFAFDWLCNTTRRKPEIQSRAGSLEDDGYHRIISLQPREMVVFRPASKTFPLLDFVVSMTKWFNAKAVDPEASEVIVRHKGALEFLTKMQKKMLKVYTLDDIHDILKREPPVLTVLTNQDVPARLDKEVELSSFGVPVRMEVMNVNKTPTTELLGIERTELLLREIEEYVG